MSTPWTTISRSPLALSMRMSVLAPGQPTAVRTSLRGGRLMTWAARCCGSLEDPAVDLEHLGELAADVDAAREGDVADVVLAGVVAVALALVAGQGLHLLLDVALLEPHVGLVREVEVVPGDLVGQHRGALEGAQALLGDGLVVLVQVDDGGVGDLDAVLDEARHGAAAAELAVVGVRRQDEHVVEAFDAHVRYSPR